MKRIVLLLTALVLCMCMPMKTSTNYKGVHSRKPLYSLDAYEKSYSHYLAKMNENNASELMTTLSKYIVKPSGSLGVVPPGVHADYALLMIGLNDDEAGLKFAQSEIALYPEAETYIKRLLQSQEK